MADALGSLIGFGQLGLFGAIAYVLIRRYGTHLTSCERSAATWFAFNAACHLLFEGKEYAKSDFRWGVYDVATLSVEVWTVFFCGPLSLALVWAIWTNNKWRHPMQVVLCVCELYGGWMTFAPEWFAFHPTWCPNLVTSIFYLWFYLIIPNGVWVVVPLWLLWDSLKHYFALLDGSVVKVKAVKPKVLPVDEPLVVAVVPKPRSPKKAAVDAAPRSPQGRKKKTE